MRYSHSQHSAYLPWVMLVAPAMSVGAVVMSYLAFVPRWEWLYLPSVLVIVSVVLVLQRRWRVMAWLVLGLSVGEGLMHLTMLSWQAQQIPAVWWQQTFSAEVMIDGIAKPAKGGWQCELKTLSAPVPTLTDLTLQAYWQGDRPPLAGEVWQVTLRLQPAHSWMNPGGFDYEAYLFTRGISAQATVLSHDALPNQHRWHWQASRWLIFSHLQSVLPDSAFKGLNIALLMGEASLISQAQWQVLRDTGTLHLAVVSGMHLTLVGALAGLLASLVWRWFPSERFPSLVVSAWVAFVAASLFALLAGLNLPVQRAWIMISVVLLAMVLKRHLHPLLSLSWALLCVMLWDITSVMQAGFWLSFLATGALVWLLSSPDRWWWKLIGLQLGMSFLLAPFLLLLFQQIPLYAPLANLIAGPVVESLLVPLLLVAGILSPLLPAWSLIIGAFADGIWGYLWAVLAEMSVWPSAILLLTLSGWHWPVLVGWGMILLGARRYLLTPLGLLWLSLPSVVFPLFPVASSADAWSTGHQRMILLETGTLLPVMIWQGDRGNWLFGTGEWFGSQHTMRSTILPALIHLGIHHLDGVWLWHDNEAEQQGLQLLQAQRTVLSVKIVNQACRAETDWAWQLSGKTCWLGLPLPTGRVWLSADPVHALPKSLQPQDVIIASRLLNRSGSVRVPRVRAWVSQADDIPVAWSEQYKNTTQAGAVSLIFAPNGVTLNSAREDQGRFFSR